MDREKKRRGGILFAAIFIINLAALLLVAKRESRFIDRSLMLHAQDAQSQAADIFDDYTHSFRLFSEMLTREIQINPDPDDIWDYLKELDGRLLEMEGDTFDGLYLYYQGRYLYSWDTPYSQYESTGYVATERPWYLDAAAGKGKIVFTPPYMSYANHYILSTISQMQPDGETVFAYDIKMGDIQNMVSSLSKYPDEQMMVFDENGTVIGSTNADYLGGDLFAPMEEVQRTAEDASAAAKGDGPLTEEQREKLEEEAQDALAFCSFRQSMGEGLERLAKGGGTAVLLRVGNRYEYGYLSQGGTYRFLILVPALSMLGATVQIWLLPILLLELLLLYLLDRRVKEQKNRELKAAYVELGQTQKRLEIALSAAQKAAAIDDLTGMMNYKSFRKGVSDYLESMAPEESGILMMLDSDHFKAVNDNYGHMIGDEVIKLIAQMMIGRIRVVDFASRLHGDEFAIFVAKTNDYSVAKRILEDINATIAKEAQRRNMPAITLSAGAVTARRGDTFSALAKIADAALYEAKKTHNGGFQSAKDH